MPKGNDKIIFTLNQILTMELTGINQYLINRGRYVNWQLSALVNYIDERIADERRHYDMLLDRILYLQGVPVYGKLNPVNVGLAVPATFEADSATETASISAYNDGITKAVELKDDGTRALFESILKDEEDHLNDLEARLGQIEMTGLQIFLGQAIKECNA